MSEMPVISTLDKADSAKAYAALTAGFIADPLFRWAFPNARDYLEAFPKMLDAYCGSGIADGTAFCDKDFVGVCIWVGTAPPVHPMIREKR